jgi:hypothetical protein
MISAGLTAVEGDQIETCDRASVSEAIHTQDARAFAGAIE